MQREALFSPCRTYRYALWRTWETKARQVLFIGLNPSTADEVTDDPTIRRCIRFARDWGYGKLCMVNVFAYRHTDPSVLKKVKDPVGKQNMAIIQEQLSLSDQVILAWGNHAGWQNRYEEVLKLIKAPFCLRVNKSGQPAHPLYLPADLSPVPYRPL